jgi:hypothetical protein
VLREVCCPLCRFTWQVSDGESEKDLSCPACHNKRSCPSCGKAVPLFWRTCPYCEAALVQFRSDARARSGLEIALAVFGGLGLAFWFAVLVLNLMISNLWVAVFEIAFILWLIGLSAGFHYYRGSRDEIRSFTATNILFLALVIFGALNIFTFFCFCPFAFVILPDPFK